MTEDRDPFQVDLQGRDQFVEHSIIQAGMRSRSCSQNYAQFQIFLWRKLIQNPQSEYHLDCKLLW